MKRSALILILLLLEASVNAFVFDSSKADSSNSVTGLSFKSRFYAPTTTSTTQSSSSHEYGFGVGGVEHFVLDSAEGYIYTQSALGYISIIDSQNVANMSLAAVEYQSLDLRQYSSQLKDIAVCGQYLFVTLTGKNHIQVYNKLLRNDRTNDPLELTHQLSVEFPQYLFPSPTCKYIAVTNHRDQSIALVQGAVRIITQLDGPADQFQIKSILFTGEKFTDNYLLGRQVHMPLTKKSMRYWDSLQLNFQGIQDFYNPSIFMEAQSCTWRQDETLLLCSLQAHSALVRIDVVAGKTVAIDGYGLKRWNTKEVDIIKDKGCGNMVTDQLLFSTRSPNGIVSVEVDNELYVLTAEQGGTKQLSSFDETIKIGDIFNDKTLGLINLTVSLALYQSTNPAISQTAPFNSQCESFDPKPPFCAPELEVLLGSSSIDYETDPTSPQFKKIVMQGGRGISAFKVPISSSEQQIELTWDSGNTFESTGCAVFPWSHNGVQDERFSPVDGPFYVLNPQLQGHLDSMNDPEEEGCADAGNGKPGACPMSATVDSTSLKNGPAPQSIQVGTACGRLVSVACNKKNAVCFLHDITNIKDPALIETISLSPASKTQSPGVAYAAEELGDIDPRTIRFIDANEALGNGGKAGILFGGALSSTISFWEFQCQNSVSPPTGTTPSPTAAATSSSTTVEPTQSPIAGTPANSLEEFPGVIRFDTNKVGTNSLKDITMVDRFYVPYGPDLLADVAQSSTATFGGFGFGLNGVYEFAYDTMERYIYALSKMGYVTVMDKTSNTVTPYSLDLSDLGFDLLSIALCSGYFFVSVKDDDNVYMYETVKRDQPQKPNLAASIPVGGGPNTLSASPSCSMIAVANAAEGPPSMNTQGGITLISDFKSPGGPNIQKVPLTGYTDEDLEKRFVHMPLTERAMEYWDRFSHTADDVDWSEHRQNYNPAMFLRPNSFAWSADETILYVNFQQNSALLRIELEGLSLQFDGYGLKHWGPGGDGIDITDDDGCSRFVTNSELNSIRSPSAIASVEIDGTMIILTAEQGAWRDFDKFSEKMNFKAIIHGNEVVLKSMTATAEVLENINDIPPDLELSVGQQSIDYESNPMAPIIRRLNVMGGRGISIYKMPPIITERISHVWDSGSDFEKRGCAAYHWAHNGIQDEIYSLVDSPFFLIKGGSFEEQIIDNNDPVVRGCANTGNGEPGACPMSETVDKQSTRQGMEPESIIVAEACDRLLTISCTRTNANCFVYDITDVNNPELKMVINVSPASENKSPNVAYDSRELGEIDPRTLSFVRAEDSPTQKSGFFIGGALSATISFWEFECVAPVSAGPPLTRSPTPAPTVPAATPSPTGPPSPEPTPVPATDPTPAPVASASTPRPTLASSLQPTPPLPTRKPTVNQAPFIVEDIDEGPNASNGKLSGGATFGIIFAVFVITGSIVFLVVSNSSRKEKAEEAFGNDDIIGEVDLAVHDDDVEFL